jgi:hypothetical protein
MSEYKDNYIERKIEEYSQDKLIEAGIVLLENEREIKTLEGLCVQFCCLTECKNCPVHIHDYEKRTEYEKCSLHEPCVVNLLRWVKEEVLKKQI